MTTAKPDMVVYSPAFGGVDQLIVIQESRTLCDVGAMLDAIGEGDFDRLFMDDDEIIVINMLGADGVRYKVELMGLADASRLLHIIGTERANQYRRWFHQEVEPIVKAEMDGMRRRTLPDDSHHELVRS